jgi:hypothetical protein
MKIKTVNLINVVGMNRNLEAKDWYLTPEPFGVVAEPKGSASFRNRPRLVPWANISSCDVFTEEEYEKLQLAEAAREAAREVAVIVAETPSSAPVSDGAPAAPAVDDTIRFTKSEGGGIIETKGPKPAGDSVKSAFASVAKAKAQTQPE